MLRPFKSCFYFSYFYNCYFVKFMLQNYMAYCRDLSYKMASYWKIWLNLGPISKEENSFAIKTSLKAISIESV